jgi:predicted nucleic acid-binding protein
MLDKVKSELCRSKRLESDLCNFLNYFKIPVIPFPKETVILKEYAHLLKFFGEGESACMAVARHHSHYIANSNLKDIKSYCQHHNIRYYTTMDLIVEAVKQKVITESEADRFIADVKNTGSRLPCDTLKKYLLLSEKSKLEI